MFNFSWKMKSICLPSDALLVVLRFCSPFLQDDTSSSYFHSKRERHSIVFLKFFFPTLRR